MSLDNVDSVGVAGTSLDGVKKSKKGKISLCVGGFFGKGKAVVGDVSFSEDGDSSEKTKRKRSHGDYSDSDTSDDEWVLLYDSDSDTECDDPSSCTISSPSYEGSCATPINIDACANASIGSQPVEPSVGEDKHSVQPEEERKKGGRPETWAANVAKRRKNLGLSYQSIVKKTGAKKTVPAKKVGPPCSCKNKCFSKVGDEAINKIFQAYWSMGDYNLQTAYLQRHICREPIKRKRTKAKESKKKWTLSYFVTFKGKDITICKAAFLSIHAITAMRTQVAMEKISKEGKTIKDLRGTNPNTRKITEAVLKCVHEHIQLLPVCSSHYTRKRTPDWQYLESRLSLRALYEKYLDWMDVSHPDVAVVKLKYYNKIFSRHYKIGFRPVKKDACSTCEQLTKALEFGRQAGTDISHLEQELQLHREKISVALNAMNTAKFCNSDWVCVALDLQQPMPCPRLSVSSAFYKRKLWLYNFCVHITSRKTNHTYMYGRSTLQPEGVMK
ncbi:uncharacterized protein [Macrobrachium rosenbergii]|uniref:uncharacterized protein n=1 Tax=Macrobrachium rosenbergii TaxID=79674 RepID=UPI0034D5D277